MTTAYIRYPVTGSSGSSSDLIVNVKDFGAAGNGVNNDTSAIQNAINSLTSPGTVFFPAGTYIISTSLIVPTGVSLAGAGSNSSIISCSATTIGITTGLPYIKVADANNVSISNLQINGNGSFSLTPFANPYSAGNSVGFTNGDIGILIEVISNPSSSNFRIQNCEFQGLEYGIVAEANTSQFLIENNYFTNLGTYAVTLNSSEYFTIIDNYITGVNGNQTIAGDTNTAHSQFGEGIGINSSQYGVVSRNQISNFQDCGILVEPANPSGSNNQYLVISNNLIYAGQVNRGTELSSGIYVGDGNNSDPIMLSNNIIYNIPAYGIISENCKIEGGSVYNCGYGIFYDGNNSTMVIDGVDIRHNHLGINVTGAGISSSQLPVTIKNCILYQNAQCGILSTNSSAQNVEISNNYFEDNGVLVNSSTTTYGNQYANNCAICIYGNSAQYNLVIRNNTFISSANYTSTTGQLYGMGLSSTGLNSGSFQNVYDNNFIYTGTLQSYPTSMNALPSGWAEITGSYTWTPYELTSLNNRTTKLPYSQFILEEGSAGFPRFLGYAGSAPGSGTYLTGDYYLNYSIGNGVPFMFMCTSGGTPGTWQSWGGQDGTNTIGTIDSQTPSSNGLILSGTALYAQSASTSNPGMVNTTTQSFGGAKTFTTSVISGTFITAGSYLSASTYVSAGSYLSATTYCQAASFIPTGSSVPANGMYLPTTNSIGFSTNTTNIGSVSSAGLWTLGASGNTSQHTINGGIATTAESAIYGTATNDNAATGYIGEAQRSDIPYGSQVNMVTTGVYANITSISLTAGDWDVTGIAMGIANSAVLTGSYIAALSAYSGNTTTDEVDGDNRFSVVPPTTSVNVPIVLPAWRVSISSTTIIYMKAKFNYTGGPPQAYGRLSARRVR